MKCDVPGCDKPPEVYVIRRHSVGPYGGIIKTVQYKVGKIIDVANPAEIIGEKRCLEHGLPKVYWRRHLQNSLDFLRGV
jgi:hypothetical protein